MNLQQAFNQVLAWAHRSDVPVLDYHCTPAQCSATFTNPEHAHTALQMMRWAAEVDYQVLAVRREQAHWEVFAQQWSEE